MAGWRIIHNTNSFNNHICFDDEGVNGFTPNPIRCRIYNTCFWIKIYISTSMMSKMFVTSQKWTRGEKKFWDRTNIQFRSNTMMYRKKPKCSFPLECWAYRFNKTVSHIAHTTMLEEKQINVQTSNSTDIQLSFHITLYLYIIFESWNCYTLNYCNICKCCTHYPVLL